MVKRIVLAILLLAFAGCASRPGIPPTVERRKEELLKGLNRSYERLTNMRGRGRIAVSTGGETYSGNFSLLYKNPDKLKIDIHGPLGIKFLALSVVEDSVLAVLPFTGIAYVSSSSTPGVGGLGEAVTADKLTEFVTATVSAAHGLDPNRVEYEHNDQSEVLVFEESGLVNKIAMNPKTGVMLTRDIYGENDRLLLSCEYARFKLTGRVLRPYMVTMREGGTDNSLEMVYEHQSLNGRVRDRDFDLSIPMGIEVIQDQ